MAAMQKRAWMGGVFGVLGALGFSAGAVADSALLLPGSAFRTPVVCALAPFDALDAVQLERRLRAGCDPAPRGAGLSARQGWERHGGRLQTWVGQALAWGDHALNARLRWDATARLGPQAVATRTELAAGLWWQPQAQLAVDLQLGGRLHGDGDIDHSVSMTGAWQPSSSQLLFSRVNHDGVQTLHEVGMRLWLRAQRISLDASMPTDLAQEGDRARVVLAWRGFRL